MSDQNENSELKAENTRLISLLEQHRIAWRLPSTNPPTTEAVKKNSLSTEEKIKSFVTYFVVEQMSIPYAGKVEPLVNLVIRPHVPTNGFQVFVKNRESNVAIVETACWFH